MTTIGKEDSTYSGLTEEKHLGHDHRGLTITDALSFGKNRDKPIIRVRWSQQLFNNQDDIVLYCPVLRKN
jgi:hypothetical protein